MKQNILVMFGGIAPEHEVSTISGIQIMENIDRSLYNPIAIYVNKQGSFNLFEKFISRKDFNNKSYLSHFEKIGKETYITYRNILTKRIKIDAAYLAFHGGVGENGPMQGLLETYGIPYSSPSYESSAICMNKAITKEIFTANNLSILPYLSFQSIEYKNNTELIENAVKEKIGLPVVIKAVHIGSTIGVKLAKTDIELKKAIMLITQLDYEFLAEKMLTNRIEYNISVRKANNIIEASTIERPIMHDEVLSFKDKYQTGSKLKQSGMASLDREIPAKINKELKLEIEETAKQIYKVCRCSGVVRIDFMYADNKLYITEVNAIPGSLAFYLWEASGITFKQQITDSINQSFLEMKKHECLLFEYESDILKKFTS